MKKLLFCFLLIPLLAWADTIEKISDKSVRVTKTVTQDIDIRSIKRDLKRVDDTIDSLTKRKNELKALIDQAKDLGVDPKDSQLTK